MYTGEFGGINAAHMQRDASFILGHIGWRLRVFARALSGAEKSDLVREFRAWLVAHAGAED